MIYLDNHATTPCDPVAVEQMIPWFTEHFANPHSPHEAGKAAAEAIDCSIEKIAKLINTATENIIVTSGATESNQLAIRGAVTHPRQKKRHLVSVTSEHPAVLDVLKDLESEGFEVTLVPVLPQGHVNAGTVDLDRLAEAISDKTALVSVMWANNENGAINPMAQISEICLQYDCLLHSDATQALGRLPLDLQSIKVDLLSATAHKFYGPKGTGFLVMGGSGRRVRIRPQLMGGGQQSGLRSGTMNPAGIIGMSTALEQSLIDLEKSPERIGELRGLLWSRLSSEIEGLEINGPSLEGNNRLQGNLNLQLPAIEGQAWLSATPNVLFSSGSACSGHDASPSHVLSSLGLTDSQARRSVRFGIGRFNDLNDIETASRQLVDSYFQLVKLNR